MYVKQEPDTFLGLPFYDACPLIFCTNVDDKSVTGINFNLIPNNIRAAFLDIITSDYESFYKEMENNVQEGMVINQNLGAILTSPNGLSTVIAYVKQKSGVDLSSCIRRYNRANIGKVRMIEYDQWHYIPFLSFKDSVRGTSLAMLQAEFIAKQQ